MSSIFWFPNMLYSLPCSSSDSYFSFSGVLGYWEGIIFPSIELLFIRSNLDLLGPFLFISSTFISKEVLFKQDFLYFFFDGWNPLGLGSFYKAAWKVMLFLKTTSLEEIDLSLLVSEVITFPSTSWSLSINFSPESFFFFSEAFYIYSWESLFFRILLLLSGFLTLTEGVAILSIDYSCVSSSNSFEI